MTSFACTASRCGRSVATAGRAEQSPRQCRAVQYACHLLSAAHMLASMLRPTTVLAAAHAQVQMYNDRPQFMGKLGHSAGPPFAFCLFVSSPTVRAGRLQHAQRHVVPCLLVCPALPCMTASRARLSHLRCCHHAPSPRHPLAAPHQPCPPLRPQQAGNSPYQTSSQHFHWDEREARILAAMRHYVAASNAYHLAPPSEYVRTIKDVRPQTFVDLVCRVGCCGW